jgi:hypothetical protein
LRLDLKTLYGSPIVRDGHDFMALSAADGGLDG